MSADGSSNTSITLEQYNLIKDATEKYCLYFCNQNNEYYGYWLASPRDGRGSMDSTYDDVYKVYYSASNHEYYAIVGNYNINKENGIRPVVCLQAGAKLQKDAEKSTNDSVIYKIVK